MFADDAFADPGVRGTLVKSPLEFVVGTHRALALDPEEPLTLVRAVRSMQQIPYEPPNVRGWVGGERWINAATLLARRRFVGGMLRSDALDLIALRDGIEPDALVESLLALAPITPLPDVPPADRARTGAARTRGRDAVLRAEPVARLLRDPVYHLC